MSAGTSEDADNPVSGDLIEWAEVIFAMERVHRQRLNQRFGSLMRAKQVVVLGIPDKYKFMDPELVEILNQRVPAHLPG
jgi:predicted protein tyrosine phosphatase